ncbi:MAG: glycosyltransferase [Clostridia bacterium]|nr:glycosyltransferase [Clostridia bacterium]
MSQETPYLLSILIPTQNRQFYCAFAVKQIYACTDDRVQIVVQDNSDDDSLRGMLEAEAYGDRVDYYYTADVIPCSANYNAAISHAKGEYVCSIGDDDGVLPQIVEMTELAKRHGIGAVHPNVGAVYYWPAVSEGSEGKLILGRHNPTFTLADPKDAIRNLLSEGCQNYMTMNLAKGYHGIVRRDFYEKVYQKTGRYCDALSSDMFMCVTLSLTVDRVLVIDHPVTVSGACRASTSGDSINKKNFGPLESAPHFVGQEYHWSELVPAFYSGNTVWADSGVHAFEAMGRQDLLSDFNIEKLCAVCTFKYPQFESCVLETLCKNDCDMAAYKRYLAALKKTRRVSRFKSRLAPLVRAIRGGKGSRPANAESACPDIIEAVARIDDRVQDSFQSLLRSIEARLSEGSYESEKQ